MGEKLRVVHYLNQFFAQIGGEEKADVGPELRSGMLGQGRALQRRQVIRSNGRPRDPRKRASIPACRSEKAGERSQVSRSGPAGGGSGWCVQKAPLLA